MKLHTGEQPIERSGAHDEGHAGGDGLVLDRRELQFSTLPWPPSGWWVIGRYFRRPQRHQVAALIRVAPDLRAILASHVTLQFVDRCRLRPTDNIQRHRLVRIAAEAPDFEIAVAPLSASPNAGEG